MMSFNHIYYLDNFRYSNVKVDDVGYNLCVFVVRYQQNFTASRPIEIEIIFDGVVPNDINGYALVITKNFSTLCSDGQRHFDLI